MSMIVPSSASSWQPCLCSLATSFPRVGFKTLLVVPTQIKCFHPTSSLPALEFYKPPKAGYRAVYVYQVTLEHNLFGWLYNDGMDDLGRSHIPYFLCYYLESDWTQPNWQYFLPAYRGTSRTNRAANFPSRSYSFSKLVELSACKGLETREQVTF